MKSLIKHIQNRSVLELELFNGDMYQDGVCITSNNDIWTVVNYDRERKQCDGITIFKNKDVEQYSVYKKKFYSLPDKYILYDPVKYSWLSSTETFEGMLIQLKETKEIVAFFTELDSYYVGVVSGVENKGVSVKIITTDGIFNGELILNVEEILFISFNSGYEGELGRNLKYPDYEIE